MSLDDFKRAASIGATLVLNNYGLKTLGYLNEDNEQVRLSRMTRDTEAMPFLTSAYNDAIHFVRLSRHFGIVASASVRPHAAHDVIKLTDGRKYETGSQAYILTQVGVHIDCRKKGYATEVLETVRDWLDAELPSALFLTSYGETAPNWIRKVRSVFAGAPIPVFEFDSSKAAYSSISRRP